MIISKAPCHWSKGIFMKRSEGIDQKTGFILFKKTRHDFPGGGGGGGNELKSRWITQISKAITETAPLSPVELGFIN